MNDQHFWEDKNRSERVLREVAALKARLEPVKLLGQQIADNSELIELAREEEPDLTACQDDESDGFGYSQNQKQLILDTYFNATYKEKLPVKEKQIKNCFRSKNRR